MTQQGFEDYLYTIYDQKNGTTNSYITAIHIIDEMFRYDDVFALNGKSLMSIDDFALLQEIVKFVCDQQTLYIKGEDSIFRNVSSKQSSYPGKRFCSAAIKRLLEYSAYLLKEEEATELVKTELKGKRLSQRLIDHFDLNKQGNEKNVTARVRLGQSYFRKVLLEIYGNKCCVTGLNIPETLRASHIVAWSEDKKNRMNPENGLCLSATYDAAFDRHLISFDDNYRMVVSKRIKDYYTNDVAKDYFQHFEGKQIALPSIFEPSKLLLAKHRELMVS